MHRGQLGRLSERQLLVARHPCRTLDVFKHAVQDRPSEVRLGIGEAGRIVRAGSFDQGEIAFAFQVF